jgi:Ca-activated chloride channel homolog
MNEILNNSQAILEHLHFVRADWFYAFIPLILFLLLSLRKTLESKNWRSVIDPQLMPFVLSQSDTSRQRRYPLILVFIAASLCITALAGPVYKKLPQPVYREQSSLVVLLDLSQSMNATDVKPSRLARAKLELLDILKTRKTGQTALVVYAADAFVVTPLTDDNATIANLVPSLETSMMPAQGSNLTAALNKTLSLFSQAGIVSGDILLITDDVHQRDESAIEKAAAQGHRLSIFGIGTASGGPVPLQDGGFLLDRDGAIVIPKLDATKLQRYALTGGGLYTGIKADDSDARKLSRLFQSSEIEQGADDKKLDADIWQEEGHWLLLPLIFFAALWARKGWIAALIPFVFIFTLSLPNPAYAESSDNADRIIDTENLWSSPDQKAMKAFNQGDNKTAAEQFSQPEWKASAYYRSGNYEAAARVLENSNSSDAYYNKANALARLGKYQDAIQAYDKAIELDENNEDAKYNLEQVKQALEKQQQQNDQQQDDSKQDSDENKDNKQDQQQSNEQQKEQQQKDQQSQQQDSQSQEQQGQDQQDQDQQNQNQENQESDQSSEQSSEDKQNEQDKQQAEEQQLKQRDAESEKKQQEQEQQQYQQDQKQQEQKDQTDKDEQQQADKEQQEQSDEVENADSEEKPAEIEVNPTEASITEEEKATEQWLKRIPDDPGGLLRRKFYYQYNQLPNQTDDKEPW